MVPQCWIFICDPSQQHFADAWVAVIRGVVERRPRAEVLRVAVGPQPEEEGDGVSGALLAGQVEGGALLVVHGLKVGTFLFEVVDHVAVVLHRGEVERCSSTVTEGVDFGSLLDQDLC